MAFSYYKNFLGTGSQALYQLKELCKSVGWTVPRSSDGTTYNSSGDQITSGSSGANGMANNNAWFVLRSPNIDGYNIEFCFQRGTTNIAWRNKICFNGFTGGSPSATITPTATDQFVIFGGGTDSSPSFSNWITTDSTYRGQIIAGDVNDGYSIYFGYWTNGSGLNPRLLFGFDRLIDSSCATNDIFKYCVWSEGNLSDISAISSGSGPASTSGPRTIWRKNFPNNVESYSVCPTIALFSGGFNTPGYGTNPWNGKDDAFPVIYGQTGSGATNVNYGFKGISKNLSFVGVSRTSGDTLSVSSTRDRIIIGILVLPWDGSIPTI